MAAAIQAAGDLPCRPCHKPTCALVHHRCMRDIAVDEVLAATRSARANITVPKPG
jgi:heptosyltransferase-2